jgi:hypothetical protein
MVANSGPVSKNEHLTQTEKDITNSKEQMNKNEKISQDVLNQLESEREKRNNIKNYARNWN